MLKNVDGSVTLSKDELSELNNAYQAIIKYFSAMPFSMGDMFEDDTNTAIRRWEAQLDGREYIPDDEEDEEDEE